LTSYGYFLKGYWIQDYWLEYGAETPPTPETPTVIITTGLPPHRIKVHKPRGLLDNPELMQLLKEWLLID
jgi:hypothetical protein